MAGDTGRGKNVTGSKKSYRQIMKERNPEKYEQYLRKQRERSRKAREALKKQLSKKDKEAIAKKTHQLTLQRQRQKKYTETKQIHSEENQRHIKGKCPKIIIKTRHNTKCKREYNRERKRISRANMTTQKKNWIKKKDREAKATKRKKARNAEPQIHNGTPFSSKKTEWNVTSKARRYLPSSPSKFAKVLNNLATNSSPPKKQAFETLLNRTLQGVSSLAGTLKKTSKGKSALKEAALHYKNQSIRRLANALKLNRRTIVKERKGHFKKKVNVVNEVIRNFYFREDISRVLPQKRYSTKAGPGYLMQVSVTEAHALYNREHTVKVSLGRFAGKRPRNVRKLDMNCREFCCCVYCINIRQKLLTLSRYSSNDRKLTHENQISGILLCQKSDADRFFRKECIEGRCQACGSSESRREKLNAFYQEIPNEKTLTWNRWTYKEVNNKKKRTLVTNRGQKDVLLNEFVKDIEEPTQGTSFFQHLHTANWQTMQFRFMKENLPVNHLLQVMDFARNREVKYQDEVKCVYYSKEQITMHPIVSYYKTPEGTVREADIVISDDINHDHYAVKHYEDLVYNHIVSTWKEPDESIIFSDGCSSQYKSKGPFNDLANLTRKVNRNYFGSEHGKGDCDAEIGVVNRLIDRAIIGNKVVINDAYDTYKYCAEHLEVDDVFTKRKFFYVKKGDINREEKVNAKTVTGTRKMHQIQNDPCNPGVLYTRDLSCFCCKTTNYVNCVNSRHIQPFKRISLHIKPPVKKTMKPPVKEQRKLPVKEQMKPQVKEQMKPPMKEQIKPPVKERRKLPIKQQMKPQVKEQMKPPMKEQIKPPVKERRKLPVKQQMKPQVKEQMKPPMKEPIKHPVKKQLKSPVKEQMKPQVKEQIKLSVKEHISERESFFKRIQNEMEKCVNFNQLSELCISYSELLEDLYPIICPPDIDIISTRSIVDQVAMDLMPNDYNMEITRLPVKIFADGNCLPRCGSMLAFGTEENHREIRTRIVIEQVLRKSDMLTNTYLEKGILNLSTKGDLLCAYTMYSDFYKVGQKINKKLMNQVYEDECLSIVTSGSYMGIWQLHALSNVLKCPINSIYPTYGGSNVRRHLHRRIIPSKTDALNYKEAYIMWSSLHMVEEALWTPNHFVLMLQVDNVRQEVLDVMEENIVADDINDVSLPFSVDSLDNSFQVDAETFNEIMTIIDVASVPSANCLDDATPAIDLDDATPAIDLDDATPAIDLDDTTPAIDLDDATPAIDLDDATPAIDLDDTTPAIDLDDATPAIDLDDATPAIDLDGATRSVLPEDDQDLSAPLANESWAHSPPSQRGVATDLDDATPDVDLVDATPAIDLYDATPAIDLDDATPAIDLDDATPSVLPEDDQDLSAPLANESWAHSPPSQRGVATDLDDATPDVDLVDATPAIDLYDATPAMDLDDATPAIDLDDATPSVLPEDDQDLTAPLAKESCAHSPPSQRFSPGSYVAVRHGNTILPAVVEDWPWVKFYLRNAKKGWTPGTLSHTVVLEDIEEELAPPDVCASGSRIYYQFESL